MKLSRLCILLMLSLAAAAPLGAQSQPALSATQASASFVGDWQGTLVNELRIIVHLEQSPTGDWKGILYSPDQTAASQTAENLTVTPTTVKFTIDALHVAYEGNISTDGATITGTFTQGGSMPLVLARATKETAWKIDPGSHTVQFISVEPDVKLEVLDYGGTGRPLVLIQGLGNDAHVWDTFAPQLTATHHVYAITRRGFGASSKPAPTDTNYSADRLGDDVLAVLGALHLEDPGQPRPVLVGHSLGGEELSSVGSRHPEAVAGLIYLDAGYGYAFYDKAHGSPQIDLADLRNRLNLLLTGKVEDQIQFTNELLTSLEQATKDVAQSQKDLAANPPPKAPANRPPAPPIFTAIMTSTQKYTAIPVPVLAIFAVPHDPGETFKNDPARRAAFIEQDIRNTGTQADAFAAGVPTAHVVRLANANHYVFRSNPQDVLREMNTFLATLP